MRRFKHYFNAFVAKHQIKWNEGNWIKSIVIEWSKSIAFNHFSHGSVTKPRMTRVKCSLCKNVFCEMKFTWFEQLIYLSTEWRYFANCANLNVNTTFKRFVSFRLTIRMTAMTRHNGNIFHSLFDSDYLWHFKWWKIVVFVVNTMDGACGMHHYYSYNVYIKHTEYVKCQMIYFKPIIELYRRWFVWMRINPNPINENELKWKWNLRISNKVHNCWWNIGFFQ